MPATASIEPIEHHRAPTDQSVFIPRASEHFVLTPELDAICQRARAYLDAGYAVHLAGPSGAGKTLLAFHLAAGLAQPAVLMQGNHEMGSSDFLGSSSGYRRSRVVDNFIHTVLKTEEEMRQYWVENRLARACRKGYTLIYDEFNRSPPEANNVLLSVLEERILTLPAGADQATLRVHANFRAIFTSNPDEYAGTHHTQDALADRMVTIRLQPFAHDTEIAIAARRSGLDIADVTRLQRLVAAMREQPHFPQKPSVRTTIALATILHDQGLSLDKDLPLLTAICEDVILSVAHRLPSKEYNALRAALHKLTKEIFS